MIFFKKSGLSFFSFLITENVANGHIGLFSSFPEGSKQAVWQELKIMRLLSVLFGAVPDHSQGEAGSLFQSVVLKCFLAIKHVKIK